MNKTQVQNAIIRHHELILEWIQYNNLAPGRNAMLKASSLCQDGLNALDAGKIATAVLALGNVQGILFALGLKTWEALAQDAR